MALPEKPLTRRETYLAKAAGQDVTLPETDLTREELYLRAIAEGGGGGGVTPEYVAEAIAEAKTDIEAEIPTKTSDLTNDSGYAAIDDTTATQNKTYSSAKVEEKVAGEEITTTATGSDLTLSTSSGNLNALTVYGKSEVVDGAIKSAGEGWATVDLSSLTWAVHISLNGFYATLPDKSFGTNNIICAKYNVGDLLNSDVDKIISGNENNTNIYIRDTAYTDATAFKNSLNGVLLCYQLADPTQGNTIAVKTDNGSGTNGTMATFTTGTPLRGIPDTDVRGVMTWDGSSGEVTKVCEEKKLSDLSIAFRDDQKEDYNTFYCYIENINAFVNNNTPPKLLSNDFTSVAWSATWSPGNISILSTAQHVVVFTTSKDITTVEQFLVAFGNSKLLYPLATPTTTPLTAAENDSIAGLRTFELQTHAQNNAGATMTVEAYAGTENGKAVNELKQDVQSEISALKITQSDTLTLTTAGWSSNQQTVTYAHDTAKRNVIDVDPTNVEEWASCGILATAETASGITFSCKTVPENALAFRVTSMGV